VTAPTSLITTLAPTTSTVAAPGPVAVAPITPAKHHHAKATQVKIHRFAIGNRIKHVNDKPEPKHHRAR
jgi:hypothetical protein